MDPFFHEVIYVCFGIGTILTVIRREVNSDFDKIEGALGDDWYRIQSHIWSSDIQNNVNEMNRYIASETRRWKRKGSTDPLSDVFSDSSKLSVLSDRLNDIRSSYEAYLSFNNILENFAKTNETLKKWIDYSILTVVLITLWGLSGRYLTLSEITNQGYYKLLWDSFKLLIVLAFIILYKTLSSYSRVTSFKREIRIEKGKYSHVIRGEGNV